MGSRGAIVKLTRLNVATMSIEHMNVAHMSTANTQAPRFSVHLR